MFRLSRSFLMRTNEFNNIHNNCLRASPRQCFSEFVKTKTKTQEDNSTKSSDKVESNQHNLETEEKAKELLFNSDLKFPSYEKQFQGLSDDTKFYNLQEISKTIFTEEAVKITNSISVIKSIQLMKFLVSAKTRPVKLLKALSEKLSKNQETLDLKSCSTVMYCLAALSFKDENLLNKVANDVIENKEKITSSGIPISLLHSCAVLKYRNCDLMNKLLKAILNDDHSRRIQGFFTAFMAMAAVNYLPNYGIVILNELLKCSKTDFSTTKSYLDFVWAAVLLKQYSSEHISVVLSEPFLNQFKVLDDFSMYSESIKKKFLNINAAATCLMTSYTGPHLKNVKEDIMSPKSKYQFSLSVIDSLSHIFPKNGYLAVNIDTGAGFTLDIECCMDSKKNPVPLKKKKDSIRIAIMLLNFNEFCLGENNVETGLTAFMESILVAKGYKVVKVVYSEYSTHLKLYEKVQYLQKKLENACQA